MSNIRAILFAVALVYSAALYADVAKTKNSPGNGVGKVTIENVTKPAGFFDVTKKTVLLKANTPDYPDSLVNQDIRGKVTVGMLIGLNGTIDRAEIREGSGYGSLDTLALHSAYLFKFKPIILSGKRRVKAWVSYSILFGTNKLDSRLRGNDTLHR